MSVTKSSMVDFIMIGMLMVIFTMKIFMMVVYDNDYGGAPDDVMLIVMWL